MAALYSRLIKKSNDGSVQIKCATKQILVQELEILIPNSSMWIDLTILTFYSSQKPPKLPILVNFWSGGQTKFVNISILKKILKLLVSKNWIFINQNRCFCSCWNHLFEQNSKMPKIGLEGVKNSALWQLALIYWTNPTDSMPKMI